jgi:formylmethanofuran dehydrogenase subunit B
VTAAEREVEHVMCLGCGCGCDDITVRVRDERIVAAERACPRGTAWFGDGVVPARARVNDRDVPMSEAVDAAARMLTDAARPLVLLADDLSCEAQREGIALADRLRAVLDTLTTSTLLPSVLVAQRRGRATATFGEIRSRADVILFWGFDPAARYPRFRARVAPKDAESSDETGRSNRTVIAADIGESRGPADADHRVAFSAAEEGDALALMRAAALGNAAAPPSGGVTDDPRSSGTGWSADLASRAGALAARLAAARYAVIVHDAERADGTGRPATEGLTALAQALNGPTRSALCSLRDGGNRVGADSVVTWSTGFPLAVDFGRGAPRYRPLDAAAAMLARGELDVALVLGDAARAPSELRDALRTARCIVMGPRASESDLGPVIVVDTGVAGIHDPGFAMRSDDIPLPLRPPLRGAAGAPPPAAAVLTALSKALGSGRPRGAVGHSP